MQPCQPTTMRRLGTTLYLSAATLALMGMTRHLRPAPGTPGGHSNSDTATVGWTHGVDAAASAQAVLHDPPRGTGRLSWENTDALD
jgi:hypothetical protein